MSWTAKLVDDRGHVEGEWEYTHNCNGMAHIAFYGQHFDGPVYTEATSWWRILDGMDGPAGAIFLWDIVKHMKARRDEMLALNPGNGWGNYWEFLGILTAMRDAVPDWPTKWEAYG